MKPIYFDYNATTPPYPEVGEAMLPFLSTAYGNPSSIHAFGRQAKEALMVAKEKVSGFFGVDSDTLVFTSGGTESNNFALKGALEFLKSKGNHIVTSKVEHVSILDCCKYLESKGVQVTYLDVNEAGLISLEELEKALTPQTIFISIQTANNETGVIQPIVEISALARARGILFHSDIVQAVGKMELDFNLFDMASISTHKMYGPKGVGGLYLKKGLKLEALIHGGNQERKRRGGTENLAGMVGFGKTCEILKEKMKEEIVQIQKHKERLESFCKENFEVHINGEGAPRLCNTVNVTFPKIQSEALLLNLDLEGICASSGAACSSGSLEPSHVLMAMGYDEALALSSIRFSLGAQTSSEDLNRLFEVLPFVVQRLS